MLNLSEFGHNYHPSRVKLLAQISDVDFQLKLILLALKSCKIATRPSSAPKTSQLPDQNRAKVLQQEGRLPGEKNCR